MSQRSKLTKDYKDVSGAVVHMFHGGLCEPPRYRCHLGCILLKMAAISLSTGGGWQYQVAAVARKFAHGCALAFGYGGYQEARGSGISANHFYLENVLEELDQAGEWYYDPKASTLYHWPNGTAMSEVVAPLLDTLVSVKGAKGVSIEGIQFTETRATYLEQYEVPSGGKPHDCC